MWSLRKYKRQIWGSYKLISYLWPTKAIISFIGHILTYLETIGLFCWFLFCFLKTKMITLILGAFTFLALFFFLFFLEISKVLTKNEFRLNLLSFLLLLPVYAPFILCTSSIPFREACLCHLGLSLAMVICPPSAMTTFLLWMKLMIIRDFGLCFMCRKCSATRLMIVYRFFFLP